jgi:flagellar secretion chaperone FliS
MPSSLHEQYLETEVMHSDPLNLVRLLYRGARDATAAARRLLTDGDIAGRSRQITKAQAILAELVRSLDPAQGGPLGRSLLDLYAYMLRQLQAGNFDQIDPPLAEVEALLGTLLEAWENCAPPDEARLSALPVAAGPAAEEAHFSYSY